MSVFSDIPLVKAIVMISQMKEVARKWKQIVNMVGMIDTDMFTSEDEILCQEEKCFMVLQKWLQQSTVTFGMLISLLSSLDLKVIAGTPIISFSMNRYCFNTICPYI